MVYVLGPRPTLFEDAKPIPGTPVARMPELGAQGWELISVAVDPSPGNSTFVFWLKRPK